MRASGIGSFPGEDQRDFDTALAVVLDELAGDDHGLPFLPEVPGRGAPAAMIGRTLGAITALDADLQPAGWRLTGSSGAPGIDQRRARSQLLQDLDGLEEQASTHTGPFKVQLTGPWTLAASVERPRGDRILADHGARRELAQALALGVSEHLADLRRRLPNVSELIVQLDEPSLPAVLAGAVPTASGFGRHRTVHPPEASEALEWVLGAAREAGATPWVHCCAANAPLALLRGAGPTGLAVDLARLSAVDHDHLAEALEAGGSVALGVLPSVGSEEPPTDAQLTETVLRWLDMVGLDQEVAGERVVLTPACGLAGATPSGARRTLAVLRAAVSNLS